MSELKKNELVEYDADGHIQVTVKVGIAHDALFIGDPMTVILVLPTATGLPSFTVALRQPSRPCPSINGQQTSRMTQRQTNHLRSFLTGRPSRQHLIQHQ